MQFADSVSFKDPTTMYPCNRGLRYRMYPIYTESVVYDNCRACGDAPAYVIFKCLTCY